MTGLLLSILLLVQGPGPTVGDTIWVARTVTLPEGAEVRPAAWQLEGDVMLLGHPQVELGAGEATVRYPVVAWTTGAHTLDVPGPIIVMADGRTDSLPGQTVSVTVASVLPADVKPDDAPVQAEVGLLRETVTTPVPLLVLLGSALILFLPFAWWWRRRRPSIAHALPLVWAPGAIPVQAWVEEGEPRAVAAAAAQILRGALASALPGAQPGLVTARLLSQAEARRPALPVDELVEVLTALDAAAFGPAETGEIESLATRASALSERIRGLGA
jgi:hypothetical protein